MKNLFPKFVSTRYQLTSKAQNLFMRRLSFVGFITLCVFLSSICTSCGQSDQSSIFTQPAQPGSGPGGSDYAHADVVESVHGTGVTKFWLFQPASPSPAEAPVIVFLHGFGAIEPDFYTEWLWHLARRGNIVIYPAYQESIFTPLDTYNDNVITAVSDALTLLRGGTGVHPDEEHFAVAGHSFGGVLAANVAAMAADVSLPFFGAVMSVEPSTGGFGDLFGVYKDYSLIPLGTLLLTVAGQEDNIAGDVDALRIYRESSSVPADDKDYILIRSDYRGDPPLVADHYTPAAMGENLPPEESYLATNALDYYGLWKWFDALTDAAFYNGLNRNVALGNTPQQRFMGFWYGFTGVFPLIPIIEAEVSDP
jgi:acetyl esterase/lipase